MEQSLIDAAIKMTLSAGRQHRQLIEGHVRDTGLHRTAHMMLMHLAKNEKSTSQRELAERFAITPAAVTGVLKNLERDGYVTRTAGRDSRYNEISITPLGREVVAKSREAFLEVDRAMFDGFSEKDVETYIKLLERIENNMKRKKEEKI